MRYYKVLAADGASCNGGDATWHLPKGKRPGRWMAPIEDDLKPFSNGYYVCRRGDLVYWLGESIYECEIRGDRIVSRHKVVARQARLVKRLVWDERIARHFACDCAERVLPIFEDRFPDNRPRAAIEAARQYADGRIDCRKIHAANSAALSAARSAALSAAQSVANSAALSAADSAAWSATWRATWSAASAAASAANSAALSAASAANSATASVALSAANSAERRWQARRLMDYLYGRRVLSPLEGQGDE